jgi:hypothetical protein
LMSSMTLAPLCIRVLQKPNLAFLYMSLLFALLANAQLKSRLPCHVGSSAICPW